MKHPLIATLAGTALGLATLVGPAAPSLAATPAGIGEAGKTEAATEAARAEAAKAEAARTEAGSAAGKAADKATGKAADKASGKAGGADKPGSTHDHAPSDSMSTTAPDSKAGKGDRSGQAGGNTIDSQDVRRDAKERK